jgi:predicted deacylase
VHGEEPCGYRALERLKKSDLVFEGSVKLIVANERAREKGERYVEQDLNRSFPGDPDSEIYEERLAAAVLEEIDGLKVLDLHATKSYDRPFGFFIGDGVDDIERCGVDKAVDLSFLPETMMNYMDGVSIECGHVGTEEAAENAYQVTLNFLASQGVIEKDAEVAEAEVFQIYGEEKGSGYKFTAENFKPVEKGEVYAVNGSDVKTAEQEFVPIVMSTNGYEHKIGYKGRRVDRKDLKSNTTVKRHEA